MFYTVATALFTASVGLESVIGTDAAASVDAGAAESVIGNAACDCDTSDIAVDAAAVDGAAAAAAASSSSSDEDESSSFSGSAAAAGAAVASVSAVAAAAEVGAAPAAGALPAFFKAASVFLT